MDVANVVLGGSSSLNIMSDVVLHGWVKGVRGCEPQVLQAQRGPLKFLCPSPGYDRHFAVSANAGFENVPVAMGPDGPDMDEVRRLVEGDPAVKGIWCVPKYANPTGITYSDETVRRMAALKPAAPDFRIFWDNAYVVHDLTDTPDELLEVFGAVAEAGNDDLVYEFASTSKVTFPGSGIAAVAASAADADDLRACVWHRARLLRQDHAARPCPLAAQRRRGARAHGRAGPRAAPALRARGEEAHRGSRRAGMCHVVSPQRVATLSRSTGRRARRRPSCRLPPSLASR